MNPAAQHILEELRTKLRRASVAVIGGFRPPSDPTCSWFGAGVCGESEELPLWAGKPMFPLLQIRVSELPFVPEALKDTELLVLFHAQDAYPFGKPHGEGWLIREYSSLEGLVPLPVSSAPAAPLPFPVRWKEVCNDAPGWEDAWDVVDLAAVNDDSEASDAFFEDFERYSGTKVGGYPCEIQNGVGIADYVFQVGSEEKPQWKWADNGIGYFFKSDKTGWSWSCQFY